MQLYDESVNDMSALMSSLYQLQSTMLSMQIIQLNLKFVLKCLRVLIL